MDTSLLDSAFVSSEELGRTVNFNSTTLVIAIAVGAVLLLGLGVALYLYDYFAGTSRNDYQANAEYLDYAGQAYNEQQYQYYR